MDLDDLSQPLESVMHQESKPRPLPLRAKDHRELFAEWCRLNPEALAEMERTAMELSARVDAFRPNTLSRSSVTRVTHVSPRSHSTT